MNDLFARFVTITSMVGLVSGQISQGGTPYSHSNILADSIATINMVSVDAVALVLRRNARIFHRVKLEESE